MAFTLNELKRIHRRKIENQELSLREFDEKKLVLESRPSKVLLELTQNCNFRCRMCPQSFEPKYSKYDKSLNMPMDLFNKVATSLFPDAYFVDLRGFGETTILPEWPDVVDTLEDYPFVNWHLVTNLSIPRDELWEKMMKRGFLLGFSCDAATKETFETIRVRSHFDKILHNLELVTDRIKRNKMGFIYFIVTVQKRNIHELPLLIEMASRYSVPEVQFKIVQENGHAEGIPESMREELAMSIQRALDVAIDTGVRLTINDHKMLWGVDIRRVRKAAANGYPSPGLNFPPAPGFDSAYEAKHPWRPIDLAAVDTARVSVHQRCFKPFHYTYVAYDGRVGTCNHMMDPELLEMGDLNKSSFDEIWNGEHYQFFRATLIYKKARDPRCEWCFKHRLAD